jgi:predicted nuclease with TOPRIM domain
MKIHIETLLQRLEDIDKKHQADLSSLETRITELLRDKSRLDEFLSLRDKELKKVKDESGQALRLLEQAKSQIIKQEDIIDGL